MSQIFKYDTSSILPDIETVTGDIGGKVGPTAYNINLVGSGGVVVTGNPATSTLTISDTGIDQNQIIYVGKHGNDANDGKTIDKAKLTFQSAITATGGADYTVVCFDDGDYTENLTFIGNESIYAPNGHIIGSHILATGTPLLHTLIWEVPTGGTGFTFNPTVSVASCTIVGGISCIGTGIGVVCLNGFMRIHSDNILSIDNGNFIGSTTNSTINLSFNSIRIQGTGTVFSGIDGANITAIGGNVYNDATGNGQLFATSGAGTPKIYATISDVTLEKLSDITAGSDVKLNVTNLSGTLAEAGAGSVIVSGATRIDGVPIGAQIASTGEFTTLVASTSLQVTALGLGVTQTDATGLVSTSTGADGQMLIANTAGTAPVWANITSTGGTVDITNGSGTINLEISGGIEWFIITADLDPMIINRGYICNKAGLLTVTLPTTAAVGTIQRVTGMNTDLGWKIAQSANQQIHFGGSSTTIGAGGSLASTLKRDSVELVCVVENLEYNVISSSGNVTIV